MKCELRRIYLDKKFVWSETGFMMVKAIKDYLSKKELYHFIRENARCDGEAIQLDLFQYKESSPSSLASKKDQRTFYTIADQFNKVYFYNVFTVSTKLLSYDYIS